MTTHIDTLAEWWDNAEEGVVQKGDTVIEYLNDGHHAVYVADGDQDQFYGFYRILARAPKPKPAWHDAVAVLAECVHDAPDQGRGVFISDRHGGWMDVAGKKYRTDDLRDVTPLIEQKVTDEMLVRFQNAARDAGVRGMFPDEIEGLLTATLGLEEA